MGPQEISYPWQTPNENVRKHQAYKYAIWPSHIAAPGTCIQDIHGAGTAAGAQYCVVDFLLQFHGSSAFGLGTRFHSFAGCFGLKTGEEGGTGEACFGGWSDYLKVSIPYKDFELGDMVILEPFEPGLTDIHYDDAQLQPPYLAARPLESCTKSSRTAERDLANGGGINHQWNSGSNQTGSEDQPGIYGSRVEFDFTGNDGWGATCADDPTILHRIDYEGGDNSQARIYEIVVHIPDLHGDGSRVVLQGFTNLLGNLDPACSETGPKCVPAYIDAEPGRYVFRIPINQTVDPDEFDRYYEFDLGHPEWIEFPN